MTHPPNRTQQEPSSTPCQSWPECLTDATLGGRSDTGNLIKRAHCWPTVFHSFLVTPSFTHSYRNFNGTYWLTNAFYPAMMTKIGTNWISAIRPGYAFWCGRPDVGSIILLNEICLLGFDNESPIWCNWHEMQIQEEQQGDLTGMCALWLIAVSEYKLKTNQQRFCTRTHAL